MSALEELEDFDVTDVSDSDSEDSYEEHFNLFPDKPEPLEPTVYGKVELEEKELNLINSAYEEVRKRKGPEENKNEGKVPKLVDLAATAVGKYYEPDDIVNCDPPLDELLYQKVLSNVAPTSLTSMVFLKTACNRESKTKNVHNEAITLLKEKKVFSVIQTGFQLIAKFTNESKESTTKAKQDITVSIEFAKQQITSVLCDYCPDNRGCVHAYTAMVFRIYLPSLVLILPPITETLSTMNRDDLQRLVQLLMSGNSPSLIHECYKHIDEIKTAKCEDEVQTQIPDPTVSSTKSLALMYWNCFDEYIPFLKQSVTPVYFKGYDRRSFNRDIVKKHLKEVAHLSSLTAKPHDSMALRYISDIGLVFRTAHRRYGDVDVESRDECTINSFNFLTDFMASAAGVFIQRHNRISYETIDVDFWKMSIETIATHFRLHSSTAVINRGKAGPRRLVKPRSFSYEPKLAMPRIYPLYKDKIEQVFGRNLYGCGIFTSFGERTGEPLQDCYLSEVIASLFVPPPPEEFIQLVTDEDLPPEESPYDEPLPVMMLRANAYDYTELNHAMSEELLREKMRIVDKIILKLGENAIKYSILNIYCKSPHFNEHIGLEGETIKDNAFMEFLRDIVHAGNDANPNDTNPKGKTVEQDTWNSDVFAFENKTANTKPRSMENSPACGTRRSRRKRKLLNTSAETVETSIKPSKKRRSILKEKENLQNDNSEPAAGGESSSKQGDVGLKPKESTRAQLPEGPVDDNMSRERLYFYLLFWLEERQDLLIKLEHCYYKRTNRTECILNGIQWMTLELSRFRLTKDEYKLTDQEYLSHLESDLFSTLEIYAGDFQRNWWLFVSAWDKWGYEHYGEHFPTYMGSCVFSREVHSDAYPNKHGYDEIVFQRGMCKFMMQELKVKYPGESDRQGDNVAVGQAYENLVILYIHAEEGDQYIHLYEEVIAACLHSGQKTKVKVMYHYLNWLSNSGDDDDEYVTKNDQRGNKMKLRIALVLSCLYNDKCNKLSNDIKQLCKQLGTKSLSVVDSCFKDPELAAHVVKRCFNIQIDT